MLLLKTLNSVSKSSKLQYTSVNKSLFYSFVLHLICSLFRQGMVFHCFASFFPLSLSFNEELVEIMDMSCDFSLML